MNLKAAFPVALASLALACAPTDGVDVAGKKRYWQEIIDKEIPVGSTRDDIEAWAASRGFAFVDTAKLKHMPLTLSTEVERAPADGATCVHWQFNAMITLGPDQKSVKQYISAAGTCR